MDGRILNQSSQRAPVAWRREGGRVLQGQLGAGEHAGVIAFGVTTTFGARIATFPSQFRGNHQILEKIFHQK